MNAQLNCCLTLSTEEKVITLEISGLGPHKMLQPFHKFPIGQLAAKPQFSLLYKLFENSLMTKVTIIHWHHLEQSLLDQVTHIQYFLLIFMCTMERKHLII